MAPNLLQIVIFNLFIYTVSSNYVYQYPTNQYTPTYSPVPQSYSKPVGLPEYKTYPNYQPYQPAQANFVYPKPPIEPQSKPYPKPKPPIPEPPLTTTTPPDQKPRSPGFDTNVLNNLAIALQLLIVSNIINSPPTGSNLSSLPDPASPCSEKSPLKSLLEANAWDFMSPPNSKFLGNTDVMSLGNYGSLPKPPSPRPGGFMSPYEAINTNSFPDLSNFNSNKDFQSPYAAILAFDNNKDLFSMADLF